GQPALARQARNVLDEVGKLVRPRGEELWRNLGGWIDRQPFDRDAEVAELRFKPLGRQPCVGTPEAEIEANGPLVAFVRHRASLPACPRTGFARTIRRRTRGRQGRASFRASAAWRCWAPLVHAGLSLCEVLIENYVLCTEEFLGRTSIRAHQARQAPGVPV